MSVGRICNRSVDTAETAEGLEVATERMKQRNVGTLVVVDRDRKPIGILTDRDVATRAFGHGTDPRTLSVGDVMTRRPHAVSEDLAIEKALAVMREGPYRRLSVVDTNGRLVGLLSLDDILSLLAGEFSLIGTLVDHEGPAVLKEI